VSWSNRFLATLEDTATTPIWILESIQQNGAPGSAYRIASAPGFGDETGIAEDGIRIAGQSLNPATWSSSTGVWSVDVVETEGLFASITRGTIVRLLLGWVDRGGNAWAEADFEPVTLGQVRNISRRGWAPRWTIEVNDIFQAMKSNLSLDRDQIPLFYNTARARAVATTDYTIGAASITLDSTTYMERETGGNYAMKVAESFYLLASSVAGSVFTIYEASSEHFATTRADAAIATAVTSAAYLSGNPFDIVRRMIVSTSAGGNGIYDDYPGSWAWGLPDGWVDHNDIDSWRDDILYISSGSYTWEVIVAEPVDDGWSWLTGMLSKAGIFPAIRQGQITLRAGQSFLASSSFKSGLTMYDEDIIELLSWEAFDPSAVEYCEVTATTTLHDASTDTATSAVEDAATLPAVQTLILDQSGQVWRNTTNILNDDIVSRLAIAAKRIPEVLRLRVTLRWAQACVGDLVDMEVTRIVSRVTSTGTYEGVVALVTEVSPDYVGRTCDVRIHVYPGHADVFPP